MTSLHSLVCTPAYIAFDRSMCAVQFRPYSDLPKLELRNGIRPKYLLIKLPISRSMRLNLAMILATVVVYFKLRREFRMQCTVVHNCQGHSGINGASGPLPVEQKCLAFNQSTCLSTCWSFNATKKVFVSVPGLINRCTFACDKRSYRKITLTECSVCGASPRLCFVN